MMETQVQANVVFTDDAYLKTRYFPRADGGYTIRVGRGGRRDILSCKELYGKAVKTALELECTACAFDPGPVARTAFLRRSRAYMAARIRKNSR